MDKGRLSIELGGPPPISLSNSQKKTTTARDEPYEEPDFLEASFDGPLSSRGRSSQLQEIINSQKSIESEERYIPNREYLFSRPNEYTNVESSFTWEQRAREATKEVNHLKELIQLYKKQTEDIVQQYERLHNIRYTESEAALANYIEAAKAKDEAYASLRNSVLSRDFSLKLDFFEELTNVKILDTEKKSDGNLYKCIVAGKKGSIHFDMFLSKDRNAPVNYCPHFNSTNDVELLAFLPDFLKEEVEFERNNLSTFFLRLANLLN
ncbi:MAG: chromosome segregation protein Csm1/Pcs1-domain-containing protein [Benjaminiella poitrasii]|nr:MAG: chromosome segregation protein Csm1/Pcs1-domain-containing protein [Benjaminiella poitrasii]